MASAEGRVVAEARSLFSSIQKQGQEAVFQDSRQAAEALRCSITLIESFRKSENAGLTPSSPDWKVVNAVLGLVVTLGIRPYLKPGVGIANEKLSGTAGVAAAASAISEHLSGFSTSNVTLFKDTDTVSAPGSHILFVSGEALASLVLDDRADVKGSPETIVFSMSSLGQLVLHSYLWHIMAAYLQLACCPDFGQSSFDGIVKQASCKRISTIVEGLPVRQVVEACFMLLHRNSPGPPEWLKSEVGKQLSKLVMRSGGVPAVLEELVGRAPEGSVEIYDKVAAHLAKTPKSVATVDDYFKAICPQLLPLLLLRTNLKDPKEGETSRATRNNVFFTAVSLACKLFSVEPDLAADYLLEPLLRPLLFWSSAPRGVHKANPDFFGETCERERDEKQSEGDIWLMTENQLVDPLVQVSALLTAGHRASVLVREAILLKTKDIAPLLFKLHFRLEAAGCSSTSWAAESFCSMGKKPSQHKLTFRDDERKSASSNKTVGRDIAKGFLESHSAVEGAIEQIDDHQSALLRLGIALADFVMVHASQPIELALPTVLSLLFQPELSFSSWSGEQGKVWDFLSSKTAQPSTSTKYLACLLLAVENWPLAVTVMGKLLEKILDLCQAVVAGQDCALELHEYMDDVKVFNNEVGSKALEQYPMGATLLVKASLESINTLMDEDLVQLLLHLMNSVLKGFRSCQGPDGSVWKDSAILADISSILARVCNNACISKEVRQRSLALAEECSLAFSNPQSE